MNTKENRDHDVKGRVTRTRFKEMQQLFIELDVTQSKFVCDAVGEKIQRHRQANHTFVLPGKTCTTLNPNRTQIRAKRSSCRRLLQ